jgi:hypothetical protein
VRLSPACSTPLFTSSPYAELDTLFLQFHNLSILPSTFGLPSLVSLSLREVDIAADEAKRHLTLAVLPSLRAFAYTAHEDNLDNPAVVSHLYRTFSTVLDVFQLHLEDREMVEDTPFPVSECIVVTANSSDLYAINRLKTLRPPRFRVFSDMEPTAPQLGRIVTGLQDYADSGLLCSVYLPLLLRPLSPPAIHTDDTDPVAPLLEHLRARDVAVHWYDSSVEEEYAVSPSVWRDAQQRREEKEGRSSA